MERQLHHILCCRRYTRFAHVATGQPVQMVFEGLYDFVRVQAEVAHDLGEGIPLQLSEREEQVLARHLTMLSAPGFVDRAVHNPLGGFAYLALSDVKVVHDVIAS
jgi:hypothetical protein